MNHASWTFYGIMVLALAITAWGRKILELLARAITRLLDRSDAVEEFEKTQW